LGALAFSKAVSRLAPSFLKTATSPPKSLADSHDVASTPEFNGV